MNGRVGDTGTKKNTYRYTGIRNTGMSVRKITVDPRLAAPAGRRRCAPGRRGAGGVAARLRQIGGSSHGRRQRPRHKIPAAETWSKKEGLGDLAERSGEFPRSWQLSCSNLRISTGAPVKTRAKHFRWRSRAAFSSSFFFAVVRSALSAPRAQGSEGDVKRGGSATAARCLRSRFSDTLDFTLRTLCEAVAPTSSGRVRRGKIECCFGGGCYGFQYVYLIN